MKYVLFVFVCVSSLKSFAEEPQQHQPQQVNVEQLIENAIELELRDGFSEYGNSSIRLRDGSYTSWGSGDLYAADTTKHDDSIPPNMHFFVPANTEPFKEVDDARGGIAAAIFNMQTRDYDCPTEGYVIHWFKPVEKRVYCVKTRDGEYYGFIRVEKITATGIQVKLLASSIDTPKLRPTTAPGSTVVP